MAGENGRHYELSGLAVPESLDLVQDLLVRVRGEHPDIDETDLAMFETIDEAREAIRETIVAARDPQEVVDIVATYSKDHHATDDVTCVVIKRNES